MGSPWNRTEVKKVSLADIQSETLAQQLHEQEQQPEEVVKEVPVRNEKTPVIVDYNSGSDSEVKAKLAEMLTDEQLAAKLQLEEEDYLYAVTLQSHFKNTDICTKNDKNVKDDPDEDEVDEYGEDYEKKRTPKFHHQAVKTNGRQPEVTVVHLPGGKRELVTKHDLTKSGLRNAERLGDYYDVDSKKEKISIPNKVFNDLRNHAQRSNSQQIRHKDRSDRATSETVLDPRTQLIILRLLNNDIIADISGVINAGKESNVYHAHQGSSLIDEHGRTRQKEFPFTEYAVKVFNDHYLKNRDVYIEGDCLQHFLRSKQRPRQAIKLWAQKELKNLANMHRNGIPCPQPVGLYGHVLLMEFVGRRGFPAPMLKDCTLTEDQWISAYFDLCKYLWLIYHRCHLIHADLSEYNILYFEGHIWIIDVAQAVTYDHSHSTIFLRRDCNTVTSFFSKKGVSCVLSTRQLFDFVVSLDLSESTYEAHLLELTRKAENEPKEKTAIDQVNEAVFLNADIPRLLKDIRDPADSIERVKEGEYDAQMGLKLCGLTENLTVAENK